MDDAASRYKARQVVWAITHLACRAAVHWTLPVMDAGNRARTGHSMGQRVRELVEKTEKRLTPAEGRRRRFKTRDAGRHSKEGN